MEQQGWEARLTARVAGEVRRFRTKRGMSAQQLADRCAEVGHAVPRSVISNLENGRRESITLAELLTLARALRVSPVSLVFPVGYEARVELFPGFDFDTYDAAGWWRREGETHFDLGEPAHMSGIDLFAEVESALRKMQSHYRAEELHLERTAKLDPEHEADLRKALFDLADIARREAVNAGEEFMNARDELRLRGMTPPPLPDYLPNREFWEGIEAMHAANPGGPRDDAPRNDDDWGQL
ncbi:helix-turn-helix domain-containing protein [Streptomyces sp. NPDC005151]